MDDRVARGVPVLGTRQHAQHMRTRPAALASQHHIQLHDVELRRLLALLAHIRVRLHAPSARRTPATLHRRHIRHDHGAGRHLRDLLLLLRGHGSPLVQHHGRVVDCTRAPPAHQQQVRLVFDIRAQRFSTFHIRARLGSCLVALPLLHIDDEHSSISSTSTSDTGAALSPPAAQVRTARLRHSAPLAHLAAHRTRRCDQQAHVRLAAASGERASPVAGAIAPTARAKSCGSTRGHHHWADTNIGNCSSNSQPEWSTWWWSDEVGDSARSQDNQLRGGHVRAHIARQRVSPDGRARSLLARRAIGHIRRASVHIDEQDAALRHPECHLVRLLSLQCSLPSQSEDSLPSRRDLGFLTSFYIATTLPTPAYI